MKTKFSVAGLVVIIVFAGCTHLSSPPDAAESAVAENKLPPLPAGVAELRFGEFFVTPVGPLGLVFTDKLTSLDGKRVRMLGYMVRQEHGVPGRFLFAAIPVQLHDHDSELADDLPPAVVFVSVPTCQNMRVPFSPGLLLLTGTISVGAREEADGRMSLVRLALDPPKAEKDSRLLFTRKGAEQLMARTPER